jgi:RNA polymerase sigma factor (sigma-70 family)
MEHLTDSELVALARGGDKAAFGQLIERHQQMVRRIVIGIIARAEIACELAQEAMLQAYLSLEHLRDDTRFKSWLYGITLNVCRSYLREQKSDALSIEALLGGVRADHLALLESSTMVDPQIVAEEQELHRLVLHAVESLSPKDRVATLMFYYEQLSMEEIAAILGISVVAVKGRLHRARKQLRELLLPLYRELHPAVQRRKKMIKARINAVRINMATQQRVVILQDEPGRHALFIWIAHAEAYSIAMGLKGEATPRPLTMQFVANILKATGVQLEEVRIEALKDEIFYAIAKVRSGDNVQEIDVRPSDALALAVYTSSPIYIAEEVMERAGVPVPEGETIETFTTPQRQEEAFLKKIEAEYEKRGIPCQKEEVLKKLGAMVVGGLTTFEPAPPTPVMIAQEAAFQKFFERMIAESGSSAG